MILASGMKPARVGIPAGVALSVVTARAMPIILPMSERYDPGTFVLTVPILLAVAPRSCRRAARRGWDPTVALR